MSFPILSLTIWLPIIAGILIIATGNSSARKFAMGASILTFLVSLPLYFGFDSSTSAMQFTENVAWLPSFDINYALGVDGISMPLIVLTTMINVIVVISAWEVIKDRPAIYLGAFSIMTGLMIGVFSA
ncbi:MAG: NADH-quinone oxidoreductase subunit M, partial [Granulosicoccus sp.]